MWVKELTIGPKPSKLLGIRPFEQQLLLINQAIDKEELFNGKELFN